MNFLALIRKRIQKERALQQAQLAMALRWSPKIGDLRVPFFML